jgi:gliding motility-associated-like protein
MRFITKTLIILLVSVWNAPVFSQVVADFSPLDTAGCPPSLSVNFKNKSTGSNLTYSWTVTPGGASSNLKDPQFTFVTPAVYLVTLTISNGVQTDTKSTTVRVYAPPVASFTESGSKGCTPYLVNFTDNSIPNDNPITQYYWDFRNGTTSTLQNPSFTYPSQGKFSVYHRVTDSKGCIGTIEKTNHIDVLGKPVVNFTVNPATSCKIPTTVNFTNTTAFVDSFTYQWDFGNGAPIYTQKNGIASYTNFGTYTVRLTASNSRYGCTNFKETAGAVTINQIDAIGTLKQGTTTINNNDYVCAGNVDFSSQSIGGATVVWDFGDGTGLISQPTGAHTYNNEGTYIIKLIASPFNSCADTAKWTINVEKAIPNFTFTPVTSCTSPVNVQFSNSSTNAVSYLWTFHDNTTSTLTNPTFTYTLKPDKDQYIVHQPQLYAIKLEATSQHGCKSSITKNFQFDLPTALFSVNKTDGCAPLLVTFTDKSIPSANITSLKWLFGDGAEQTTTSKTIQHTYSSPGTYNVRLIATDNFGCFDTSYILQIKVGKKPIADFSVTSPNPFYTSNPVQLNDLTPVSDSPDYWEYSIGGIKVTKCPSDKNPSFHYNFDTGLLPVKLTVGSNGCYDDTTKSNLIQSQGPVGSFSYDINCTNPLTYNFTGTAKGYDNYLWDFGDSQTNTTTLTPSHTYSSPGDYMVNFITYQDGNTDTAKQLIRVRQPNAQYTTTLSACVNTAVKFVGKPSHPFYTSRKDKYIWDFGDSTPFIQTDRDSLTHIFTSRGLYDVQLTALYENGCTSSSTQQIRIFEPYTYINPSTTGGCATLQVTFSDTSKADTNPLQNWHWDFGDGTSQSFTTPGNSIQHLFGAGEYEVILSVTDNMGCVGHDTVTIGSALLNAGFLSTPNFPKICAGDSVTLSRPGFDVDSVEWDFGDGTKSKSTNSPIRHAYTEAGIFTVALKIYKYGCSANSSIPNLVTVKKADAHFTVSDSVFKCYPAHVDLYHSASMSPVDSGRWYFGYKGSSGAYSDTVAFEYPDTGQFIVKLQVYTLNPACTSTFTDTISVSGPVGSFVSTPKQVCKGDLVTFTMQNDTVGVKDWYWDLGEGAYAYGNPITRRLTKGGERDVTLLLKGYDITCTAPRSAVIKVDTAGAKIGAMDTLTCEGYKVYFTNESEANTTHQWDLGNTTSTEMNPVNTYTPGDYIIRLMVTNTINTCKDTAEVPLHVNPVPPILLSNKDTSICRGDTIWLSVLGGDSVAWLPNKWIADSAAYDTYARPDSTIKYYVRTIIKSTGCYSTDSVLTTVQQPPTLTIIASPDSSVVMGEVVTLSAVTDQTVTYTWDPADKLSCSNCPNPIFNAFDSTLFNLVIKDLVNCFTLQKSIQINVEEKYPKTFLPKAFNPGSENETDRILTVRGTAIDEVLEFKIYNRWGNIVYEAYNFKTGDASKGWDGTYKGKEQPIDSYIYTIKVRTYSRKEITQKGSVLLIR